MTCTYDVVILSGGFDPIHSGHINMIQEAKHLGRDVIVGINSDDWLVRKKGYCFLTFDERRAIIEEMGCAVFAFDDSDNTATMLLKNVRDIYSSKTLCFANGGDRGEKNVPERKAAKTLGIDTLYGVGGHTKDNSSSDIVSNFIKNLHDCDDLLYKKLLEKVSKEKETVNHPSHYNSGNIEVIDLIEDQGFGDGFCYGNAIKYILRAKHKGVEKEDIEKAIWYLRRIQKGLK